MACNDREEVFQCKDEKHKTLHLCPIKRGTTMPPIQIKATVEVGDSELPMPIEKVEFIIYRVGEKFTTLPTSVSDGVITVSGASAEETSKWRVLTYTYSLFFTLEGGRVENYLSGNLPVF